MKRSFKKSQLFYITKFFYYFILILPVIIYLIGLKIMYEKIKIEISNDSYEEKFLISLYPPLYSYTTGEFKEIGDKKINFILNCKKGKTFYLVGVTQLECDYVFI